ncbi:MAG: hypothetical protein ABGZ36_19330 [Actinomycetota bacterium]
MTVAKIWTIIRWPIAIVALLAVANYAYPRFLDTLDTLVEFDASGSILAPESESTETELPVSTVPTAVPTLAPPTGPVTDGQAAPIADFYVNDTVADIDGTSLILSDDPADSIVVAFDLPPGDPGCMSSLTLGLSVEDVLSTTELGIYPSSLIDAANVVDNQQVDGDLKASPSPMATALVEAEGRLELDVLGGYQSYFLLEHPPGTPFVLTVEPTIDVESQGGVRIVSANAESDASPTLTWVGTPGCPVGDGATEGQ